MIVKYNAKNIFRIRFEHTVKETKVKVAERVILVPGVNIIDDEKWQSVEKHAGVVALIKADVIEVAEKPFSDMSEKEAIRMVKNTNDPKALELWSTQEKRASVKVAIGDRLKVINEYAQNQEKKAG